MQVSAETGSIEYAGEMVDLTDAISRLPAGMSLAALVVPVSPDSNCRVAQTCFGTFQNGCNAAICLLGRHTCRVIVRWVWALTSLYLRHCASDHAEFSCSGRSAIRHSLPDIWTQVLGDNSTVSWDLWPAACVAGR